MYGGQNYDTEPAGFLNGRAGFKDQYLLALTASKTLWRSDSLPLDMELGGMLGQQWGQTNLQGVALVPVLRWSGIPWSKTLQRALRVGPVGLFFTS